MFSGSHQEQPPIAKDANKGKAVAFPSEGVSSSDSGDDSDADDSETAQLKAAIDASKKSHYGSSHFNEDSLIHSVRGTHYDFDALKTSHDCVKQKLDALLHQQSTSADLTNVKDAIQAVVISQ